MTRWLCLVSKLKVHGRPVTHLRCHRQLNRLGVGAGRRVECPAGSSKGDICMMAPTKPSARAHRHASTLRAAPRAPSLLSVSVQPLTSVAPASAQIQPVPSLPPGLTKLSSRALRFLIGAFPVPPYLLPIYQAASIEYGVPWQVLAAINQIETNFGRDLAISSAGAEGWMQFLPSTWARFGLALNGRVANPSDPIDAIFAAARYLRAAGAGSDLGRAIFAYNHAAWYVDSVELRARLLQVIPRPLVEGLIGLMQADFPVAGHLGAAATKAPKLVRVGGQAAALISVPAGAPVIAGADGRVVAIGESPSLGRYVTIEDSYGDRFTYAHLGRLATLYPVLVPRGQSARRLAMELGLHLRIDGRVPAATRMRPTQSSPSRAAVGKASRRRLRKLGASGAAALLRIPAPSLSPLVKERLFADPTRPGSYAAGGKLQLQLRVRQYLLGSAGAQIRWSRSADAYSRPLHLAANQFTLAPLRVGALVVAGTVLGRTSGKRGRGSEVLVQVTPPGARRAIDPRSIIAGWELLGRLTRGTGAIGGGARAGAFDVRNATLGQLLMSSPAALARAVLRNPQVHEDPCYGTAIARGRVDRRALAVIAYLAYSGLAPAVTGAGCSGMPASGRRFEITALRGTPVLGHQQVGGLVDLAIRQLLALEGALRPSRIVSLRSYPWESTTLALPDHAAAIEVDFARLGPRSGVDAGQWGRLARRLTQLTVG